MLSGQTFVWTPTYFLLSSENITGEFSAGYTNDKSVRGNATLELWARTGQPTTEADREFKMVARQRAVRVSRTPGGRGRRSEQKRTAWADGAIVRKMTV